MEITCSRSLQPGLWLALQGLPRTGSQPPVCHGAAESRRLASCHSAAGLPLPSVKSGSGFRCLPELLGITLAAQ